MGEDFLPGSSATGHLLPDSPPHRVPPMSTEDEAARKARAKRLRAEIDAVTGQKALEGTPVADPPATPAIPESPRDFIHRRMREIEQNEKPHS